MSQYKYYDLISYLTHGHNEVISYAAYGLNEPISHPSHNYLELISYMTHEFIWALHLAFNAWVYWTHYALDAWVSSAHFAFNSGVYLSPFCIGRMNIVCSSLRTGSPSAEMRACNHHGGKSINAHLISIHIIYQTEPIISFRRSSWRKPLL